MLEQLITIDDRTDDTDYHERIRREIRESNQAEDDRKFTPAEIKNAIDELKNKKAPGENGITGVIYKRVYKLLPSFTYTIYTVCLQAGCFPKRWMRATIIPIIKPGKEKIQDVSKYRLIRLIKVSGKVPEKLLINRVMQHFYSNNLMKPNQYGFTPRKSTTDVTLEVKEYIEEGFRQGHITIFKRRSTGGIRRSMVAEYTTRPKNTLLPEKFYNLTRSYFSDRTATLHINSIQIERDITKG